MRRAEVKMLRFRCEHCGSRLVTPERHLDSLVTCYSCGNTTHPAGKFSGSASEATCASESTSTSTAITLAPRRTLVVYVPPPTPPEIHPALQLIAAPLTPLLVIAGVIVAFVIAIRVNGMLGRVVSAAVLVALVVSGRHWLKASLAGIIERLDRIESVRLHHGNAAIFTNSLSWFWWQPRRRKPWAGVLLLAWGVIYTPYLISATLFFWPRSRPLAMRV